MTDKALHVVGNKFRELSNGDTIVTFDEVLERCKQGDPGVTRINIQQGVSEAQVVALKSALAGSEKGRSTIVSSHFDTHRRCDGALTHKVHAANTLISDPLPQGEDVYESLVMIDDDCAELSDHVTGKHIQFMVLIEAARQMANAVTQKFYSTSGKMYLAEEINVTFKAFAYPWELTLQCRLQSKNLRSTGDGKMALVIDFRQQGKSISQLTIAYTVLDKKFVSSLESAALKPFLA